MTQEEKNEMLVIYATVALPGVIITAGGTLNPEKISSDAFNVAEAMVDEYVKRTEKDN